MKLWIVKKENIEQKEFDEISVDEVGQKTLGLCRAPSAWTLPFFVIAKDLFWEICNDKKENAQSIMKRYMDNILFAVDSLKLGNNLIIRSSGTKEGMAERGKYESIDTNKSNLEYKILELVNLLSNETELIEYGMPLIVQVYIRDGIVGHASNERRFTKENRDFIYEYCNEYKQIETGNISLRNWRKRYDIEEYVDSSLNFNNNFVDKLKIICAYYYYQKDRVHIEFVCNETTLYIVQCDLEIEAQDAVNPNEYNIKMFEKEEMFQPFILKLINEKDKGKYKKIDNVFIYTEVGIPMPPLYILDDKICLEDLKQGNISQALRLDLSYMTKQSLVIRTNVVSNEKLKSQFSKRSNELRSIESAIDFLKKASMEIANEGIEDYIFILHNFIPAKIAAFVNAKPLERIVEIQALWGLPEGLYYNAHDTISVDTREININSMVKDRFSINKNEVYKECFIAPDSDGKWIVKRLKSKFNWRCTIDDDEIIRDIADRARKITENVGTELSIMWFVGIDQTFYRTNNIPWYHEKYDRNSYYYTNNSNVKINYKKKYFYEKEILIETRKDLKKLEELEPKEIGLVRIKPSEDDILRSKEFIKEVGELCKAKGANIFLEGAVLAHSFYQLVNTGATVIVAHEMEHYKDKIEFNKLVRDNIPEIIEKNGESASCRIMEGVGLVRLLKNKVIEESYEILAANSKDEVLEELADLEEVCIALEKNIKLLEYDKFNMVEKGNGEIELSFEGAVLEKCKQVVHNTKSIEFYGVMERTGSNIQLDLFFGNSDSVLQNIQSISYEENDRTVILSLAFRIFMTSNINTCHKLIYEIKLVIQKIIQQYSCKKKDFESIRTCKKLKKGGFEKGYILLRTDIQEDQEETVFNEIFNVKSISGVNIYEPLKSRVDVEILNESLLLVRLTFPIYERNTEWNIKNQRINVFFNENINIHITKKFVGTKIIFNLEFVKENYKQLVLDFV